MEIAAFHQIFLKTFTARNYIEENAATAFVDPQAFVAEYQDCVDGYLKNQILRCQKMLINRKYLAFILLDKSKFYELYSQKYENLFINMDISLAKESQIIQAKVLEVMKELKDQEIH